MIFDSEEQRAFVKTLIDGLEGIPITATPSEARGFVDSFDALKAAIAESTIGYSDSLYPDSDHDGVTMLRTAQ